MTIVNRTTKAIRSFWLPGIFIFSLTALFSTAQANQSQIQQQGQPLVTLTIKPSKCVSLRQGQTCYVTVQLHWSAAESADYCVYQAAEELPLQCWQNAKEGDYEHELAVVDNVTFAVRKPSERRVLASAELETAWVYKQRRNSASWRLF